VRRVTGTASTAGKSRVLERRRAVALARHYREFEGLSIRQIADQVGRSPATVKAYFYDPTGETARAVKARYQGYAAAAAPTPSRATVRVTPTPIARRPTPEQTSGAGLASE
jgi:IS30 family transposase